MQHLIFKQKCRVFLSRQDTHIAPYCPQLAQAICTPQVFTHLQVAEVRHLSAAAQEATACENYEQVDNDKVYRMPYLTQAFACGDPVNIAVSSICIGWSQTI